LTDTSLQWGGKILDTFTRLKGAIWALRSAASKLANFSLCRPTPLVRKILLGTKLNPVIDDLETTYLMLWNVI
jgi:hypothetical protein